MKTRLPLLALAAALVIAIILFNYSAAHNAGNPQTPASPAPATPADPALTQMPIATLINGKTVPLQTTASGLKYYDTKLGTGPAPKSGQQVSVLYTGTLLNGTKFDSTADRANAPFTFALGQGQVIPGWDQGVATMRVGGQRRLVIPGPLAYGPNPPGGAPIPPNAVLVFDITLVAVK